MTVCVKPPLRALIFLGRPLCGAVLCLVPAAAASQRAPPRRDSSALVPFHSLPLRRNGQLPHLPFVEPPTLVFRLRLLLISLVQKTLPRLLRRFFVGKSRTVSPHDGEQSSTQVNQFALQFLNAASSSKARPAFWPAYTLSVFQRDALDFPIVKLPSFLVLVWQFASCDSAPFVLVMIC